MFFKSGFDFFIRDINIKDGSIVEERSRWRKINYKLLLVKWFFNCILEYGKSYFNENREPNNCDFVAHLVYVYKASSKYRVSAG